MKEQVRRIEEIAKKIESTWLVDLEGNTKDACEVLDEADIKSIARDLSNAGYRKLPENSLVLSKEELAQKIYDDIFAILKIKLWLYGDDAMTKSLNGLTKQKILDFTKKWGIKDNHLNEKDYSHIDHFLKNFRKGLYILSDKC